MFKSLFPFSFTVCLPIYYVTMPLIYTVCCNIIPSLLFLFLYLACFLFFFTVFVCSDKNKCLARCLAWHLYESTIDPNTHTRPNMSTENWRKPIFLIYLFSLLIYTVIGFFRSHSQPVISLFIQGLVVLADLATLICCCP